MVGLLPSNEVARILLSALVGAFIGYLVSELTRVRKKRRLLMAPAMMPSLTLTVKQGAVEVSMFGDYGVVNMSDLPISLQRPHLLGYNLASRAFQFRVMPVISTAGRLIPPVEKLFEEITIPPNRETVLISDKACRITVERFEVRSVPAFVWIETLELVRLGPRKRYRWRAYLYRFHFSWETKYIYRWTGVEVGQRFARWIAAPGKWLYWYRMRRSTKGE